MKILFVLEYYYPHIGGVETFFQKLAEGLAQQNFDVTVFTSKLKGSKKYEEINGVKIKRLALPDFMQRYWFTLLAPWYLFFMVNKFDLIHTTTYNAAWPAWIASFIWRKKVILTAHEVWRDFWFKLPEMNWVVAKAHYLFEWFIFKLPFSYYTAVSDYTKNSLLKIGKKSEKLKRIYHGIDYQFFDPKKYDRQEKRKQLNLGDYFVYTYFGRPGWIKGLNSLIKAVPQIRKELPHSKLLLILSKDPLLPFLAVKKLISDLKVEENIILLNSVDRVDLPKYIVASDCVVIPSLSEGFGFTAAEACALNVPVAATTAGSLPEVLSGRVVQFKPDDSPALAEAVIKMQQKKYQEIPMKKFFWDKAIAEYIEVYKKLKS